MPFVRDQSPAHTEVRASGELRGEAGAHLLDEIDEVLETNAEDFVKSYIQKGGQ